MPAAAGLETSAEMHLHHARRSLGMAPPAHALVDRQWTQCLQQRQACHLAAVLLPVHPAHHTRLQLGCEQQLATWAVLS